MAMCNAASTLIVCLLTLTVCIFPSANTASLQAARQLPWGGTMRGRELNAGASFRQQREAEQLQQQRQQRKLLQAGGIASETTPTGAHEPAANAEDEAIRSDMQLQESGSEQQLRHLAQVVGVSPSAPELELCDADCLLSQRAVLQRLYAVTTTGGARWSNASGWDGASNTDFCTWYGVSCCAVCIAQTCRGRICPQKPVVSLDLEENGLSGDISRLDLEPLAVSLQDISFSYNAIVGDIPTSISSLTALVNLRLSDNLFSGIVPDIWHHLNRLVLLDLHANNLQGQIPPSLWEPPSMPLLKTLDLSLNALAGSLPINCLFLPALSKLDVRFNYLSGRFPQINKTNWWTPVTRFLVAHNLLEGPIPEYLGVMTFTLMDLSYNMLTGTLPDSFSFSPTINFLYLGDNKLHGTLPDGWVSTAMVELDLSGNALSGTIPQDFFNSHTLDCLWLDRNMYLSGPLPDKTSHLVSLEQLDISNTQMQQRDENIPPWLELANVSNGNGTPVDATCPGVLVTFLQYELGLRTFINMDPFYTRFSGCTCASTLTAMYGLDPDGLIVSMECTKVEKPSQFPWWAVLIIVVCSLGMIAATAVLLVRKLLPVLGVLRQEGYKRKPPGLGQLNGVVTLVFTDVEGSTELWEWDTECMSISLDMHDRVLRKFMSKFYGYEVSTEGDAFIVAFHEPMDAVSWCLASQLALHSCDWPRELLQHPKGSMETLADLEFKLFDHDLSLNGRTSLEGKQRGMSLLSHMGTGKRTNMRDPRSVDLFRGLRVRMGAATGATNCVQVHKVTNRVEYNGALMHLAQAVSDLPSGGQILIDDTTCHGIEGHSMMLSDLVLAAADVKRSGTLDVTRALSVTPIVSKVGADNTTVVISQTSKTETVVVVGDPPLSGTSWHTHHVPDAHSSSIELIDEAGMQAGCLPPSGGGCPPTSPFPEAEDFSVFPLPPSKHSGTSLCAPNKPDRMHLQASGDRLLRRSTLSQVPVSWEITGPSARIEDQNMLPPPCPRAASLEISPQVQQAPHGPAPMVSSIAPGTGAVPPISRVTVEPSPSLLSRFTSLARVSGGSSLSQGRVSASNLPSISEKPGHISAPPNEDGLWTHSTKLLKKLSYSLSASGEHDVRALNNGGMGHKLMVAARQPSVDAGRHFMRKLATSVPPNRELEVADASALASVLEANGGNAPVQLDKEEGISIILVDCGVFRMTNGNTSAYHRLSQVLLSGLENRARFFPPLDPSCQLTPGFFDAPASMHAQLGSAEANRGLMMSEVVLVFCTIESLTVLSSINRVVAQKIQGIYDLTIRRSLLAVGGYECQEMEGSYMIAFSSCGDAVEWCLMVQELMMEVPWTNQMTSFPETSTQLCKGAVIFNGPRVKMGVYKGVPTKVTPHTTTGRADYFGPLVNRAARLCHAAAQGGQVVVSSALLPDLFQCLGVYGAFGRHSSDILQSAYNDPDTSTHMPTVRTAANINIGPNSSAANAAVYAPMPASPAVTQGKHMGVTLITASIDNSEVKRGPWKLPHDKEAELRMQQQETPQKLLSAVEGYDPSAINISPSDSPAPSSQCYRPSSGPSSSVVVCTGLASLNGAHYERSFTRAPGGPVTGRKGVCRHASVIEYMMPPSLLAKMASQSSSSLLASHSLGDVPWNGIDRKPSGLDQQESSGLQPSSSKQPPLSYECQRASRESTPDTFQIKELTPSELHQLGIRPDKLIPESRAVPRRALCNRAGGVGEECGSGHERSDAHKGSSSTGGIGRTSPMVHATLSMMPSRGPSFTSGLKSSKLSAENSPSVPINRRASVASYGTEDVDMGLPSLDYSAISRRTGANKWLWAQELLIDDLGVHRFKGVAEDLHLVSVSTFLTTKRNFKPQGTRSKAKCVAEGRGPMFRIMLQRDSLSPDGLLGAEPLPGILMCPTPMMPVFEDTLVLGDN